MTNGDDNVATLNLPEERTKLLKAGVDGKIIEKLWIEHNNFRVVPKLLKLDIVI